MRRLPCACEECLWECYGYVLYHPQDIVKALKLFKENPLEGATGEWLRLYKKCGYCKFGSCHDKKGLDLLISAL